MKRRNETVQLRTPEPGDLEAKPYDFAAVRVGGAIDGHRVEGSLAEGGMGAVFRVRERSGEGEVALKTPLPGGRGGTYHNRLKRFLREARLTARMDHAGVARVREQGQCDGLPYFTLDLVQGVPLSERVYEEGVLPIGEAVAIAARIARAAQHIHDNGVVHRDLKPSNVLIQPDGSPVIIDFGLARDSLGIDPRITESGIWLGTPAYIAPEQAQGEASRVDGRADVYSLGAILYELLTGLPPHGVGSARAIFRAIKEEKVKPASTLRPAVPACLEQVLAVALAPDPAMRYADALAFARALEDLLVRFQKEPPEDDLDSSAVEGSLDSAHHVARGWTEAQPSVEPAPALTEGSPAAPARPGKKTRLRRSGPSARTLGRRTSAKARGRRRSGEPAADVLSRYLALGGPTVLGLLGLLLLF